MKFTLSTSFSWIVSVLFHPLIFTSFGALVILFWYPEYIALHEYQKSQFFSMYFMFTYILPIIAIPLYYLVLKISKVSVNNHHIRLFLLMTTTVIYFFAYNVLQDFNTYILVNMYLLLSAVLMLISFVITYFWKISLHMIGVGGFVGLMFALLFGAHVYDQNLFSLSILLAGSIGFARLQLKAHSVKQVYVGFGLGFSLSFIYLYLVFISV